MFLKFDIPIEYNIRLKIFKHWITEKSKDLQFDKINFKNDHNKNEKIEGENNKKTKINADVDEKIEYYLFKIYENIIKKKNEDISDIYVECQNNIHIKKNDYINFIRLNLLYGIYTSDNQYFEKSEEYAEKSNNLYLKSRTKLMKLEYYVRNNEFNKFDENENLIKFPFHKYFYSHLTKITKFKKK